MIPSRRTLMLLGGLVLFGLLTPLHSTLLLLFAAASGFLVVAGLFDLWQVSRLPEPAVERLLPKALALAVPTQCTLRLTNRHTSALQLWVFDLVPHSVEQVDLPQSIRLEPQAWAELRYTLRASRRGTFRFAGSHYRLRSPWGLWWYQRTADITTEVNVYPNFRAVANYALLATDNRTSQFGIKQRQRRGQGLEFHQLREYRPGDSLRQIDWRATSRLLKVISREYREERDQQIVFLLDCGRRMYGDERELTFLDHSLDAMLLLAYVALRQGDAVGLLTFGGQERWLLPHKGLNHLNQILNASFDLRATAQASDVSSAMERTLSKLRKRTLIVLLSNLRDEQDEGLLSVLRLAQARHLVLLASLREQSLGTILEKTPQNTAAAVTTAATHYYLQARHQAHSKLSSAGVLYLDVEPQQLSASLINKYLDIKASGVL